MIFHTSASPLSVLLALCFVVALTEEAHSFTASTTTTTPIILIGQNYHHDDDPHLVIRSMSATSEDEGESAATVLSAKAKALQEKADQLRQEIAALQDSKAKVQEELRTKKQAELDQQEAYMQHYSAEIPILKPDGSVVMERVQFPPSLITSGSEENDEGDTIDASEGRYPSDILVCEARLPLGMILGQETVEATASSAPPMIVVDEVLADSNGAVGGIQVGDVLRACTSCKVEMEQPTWQLLVGGIGRPKTVRFMFGTDDQPLETVLQALGANRMDPEARPVVLVVERPKNT